MPESLLLQMGPGRETRVDVVEVLGVFEAHRARFIATLRSLGVDAWHVPSRCEGWTVHDLVRHLADMSEMTSRAAPGVRSPFAGFGPRATPSEWLTASDGEPPAAAIERLEAASALLFGRVRTLHDEALEFQVDAPYGEVDWRVLFVHAFWDAWLHERDVLVPLGLPHETDGRGTRLATAYGLFLAAATAALLGKGVDERIELGGLGGGVFVVSSVPGVELAQAGGDTAGPPAAEVADSLSGRGRPLVDVLDNVPSGAVRRLSIAAKMLSGQA